MLFQNASNKASSNRRCCWYIIRSSTKKIKETCLFLVGTFGSVFVFAHHSFLELLGIFQPLLELLVVAVVRQSGRAGHRFAFRGAAAAAAAVAAAVSICA